MFSLYGEAIEKRLLLGTAHYPSPLILEEAIRLSATNIVTVSLRRETIGNKQSGRFFEFLHSLNLRILPNTAGCSSIKEALITARLARDLFQTNWIKLEIIFDQDRLQPDIFALVEASKLLIKEGFSVFPYMTDDLTVAAKLVDAGCQVLMPWCAPIGSARGPRDLDGLRAIRARFPDITLIVDAGIGRPSHAVQLMEIGCDAILLNTAIAKALSPPLMAQAFSQAVHAGHMAFKAGILEPRNMAVPSSPVIGQANFHQAYFHET